MDAQDFDVVVMGSGAGGGAGAWALSDAGLKVLVLEAGPHYDLTADYKLDRADWESSFPHKVSPEGRYSFGDGQPLVAANDDLRSWNRLSGRYNPTAKRAYFNYHRVIGVGGSSLHFTGEAHRMNPRAMRMRSDHGVAADWPVSYDELEPFYCEAEEIVGVAGAGDDAVRRRSRPYPQQAHPFSYATQRLKTGFDAHKLSFVANPLAVLSEPVEDRINCNYCGGCLRGCPRSDKGSVDITYLRKAIATGRCHIRPNIVATRIETDDKNRISGVHCIEGGASVFIPAKHLIVACGAVETPRLLLNSKGKTSPNGLANESGEVGRNFMETLLWTSSGLHPDDLGSHRGLPVDAICWDYNAPDAIPGVIGGCRFAPSLAESDLVGPIAYATRIVGGWGRKHRTEMRAKFGRALSVTGIGESLPHPSSHIRLDPAKRDANGVPLAVISSFVDDMAIRRIRFMATTCRQILKGAGATDIFEEFSSYDIFSSTHVFGTCRMGDDPKSSVVDRWCHSHRWANLSIIDASVFPSSGGGESPGLTIQALAIRSARHLAQNFAKGRG